MQCPACHHFRLKPVKLEAGLPAMTCTRCHGALLSLVSYRAWTESLPAPGEPQPVQPVDDTTSALQCPKCTRLMMKYRIGHGVQNRVDLCTHCDEAWLDGGEWLLLSQLQLQGRLASITTEPWQRRLRDVEREQVIASKFVALLGAEDWARVQDVKVWVDGHPRRQDLLRYLLRD